MKFNRNRNPALCAAKEETRYAINGVALTQGPCGRTFLAATDGRKVSMVVAETEDGDDLHAGQPPAVYPVAAFKACLKATPRRASDARIRLNGKAVVEAAGATSEFSRLDARFPDVWAVAPTGDPQVRLRFNAKYLGEVAEAIGCESVEVQVFDLDGALPMKVLPIGLDGIAAPHGDGSFGLLMPIAADEASEAGKLIAFARVAVRLLHDSFQSHSMTIDELRRHAKQLEVL
jgi:DNA polymerase III sliding clamp (beta) subunit (PCNA family)